MNFHPTGPLATAILHSRLQRGIQQPDGRLRHGVDQRIDPFPMRILGYLAIPPACFNNFLLPVADCTRTANSFTWSFIWRTNLTYTNFIKEGYSCGCQKPLIVVVFSLSKNFPPVNNELPLDNEPPYTSP